MEEKITSLINNLFEKKSNIIKHKLNINCTKSKIKTFFIFLLKNKKILYGIFILMFLLLISFILPLFYPYDYFTELGVSKLGASDKSFSFLAPFKFSVTEYEKIKNGEFIWPHIFGTDRNGRDYFIRVIYGIRISLCVGLLSAFIVLIIGIIFGAIAGMKGGKVDLIMMRIAESLYALPDLIAIIFFSVIIKDLFHIDNGSIINSLLPIFTVFALFYWIETALLIRSQVLLIKKRDFITASKIMGANNFFLIKKHIIPNCSSIIIVAITKRVPAAIFTEASLSFLGLGISEPIPSLGCLICEELGEITNYPWLTIFPVIVILLIVFSFHFIGEGLRSNLNPASN